MFGKKLNQSFAIGELTKLAKEANIRCDTCNLLDKRETLPLGLEKDHIGILFVRDGIPAIVPVPVKLFTSSKMSGIMKVISGIVDTAFIREQGFPGIEGMATCKD